ncbi:MAG: hypothetical protein N2Z69_00130 [Methylophilaceae bacterium]|nr:hypothetical protein [Methylophilaceae bacterium]
MNGARKPLFGAISILLSVTILFIPGGVMANQNISHQTLLAEIVPTIVQIMRKNGYEMADYRVIGGHTDVPISGTPEKHAFFGYVDKSWLKDGEKIILNFYEADQLPLTGRVQLIDYLLRLHEEKKGGFALTLYMTKTKYKKPQLIRPEAFLEMNLNQLAR